MQTFSETLRRFAPDARTIVSALLIAASLPPWDFDFLVWVALVPWLSGLSRRRRLGQAVLQGFWLASAIGLSVAPWIATAAHEFLQLSAPASGLVLALFSAIGAQPHLWLWAPLALFFERKVGTASGLGLSLLLCVGLALAYAGLDALVPRALDVGLGYALHDATLLRQAADLGGVSLLTCAVVLVNLIVWRLWQLQREGRASGLALAGHAALVLALFSSGLGYGWDRERELEAALAASSRSLRVGIAQGNIANDVRLAWARGDERAAEKQLSGYMLLTQRLLEQEPQPELIVWPEATFPGVFQQALSKPQRGRANKFDRQVLMLRRPIVFGAYDMEGDGGQRILFNSLFAITPDYERPGSLGFVQRYHKHELLPFAESIPGLSRGGWLGRQLPSLGFFGRGPGAKVFAITTPGGEALRFVPFICSESLSSGLVSEGVRLGGEVLLNVGSDGWFGATGEPEFHLAISRFRSIETRRSQIRAANTGISASILPTGEIVERSELGVEAGLIFDLPIVSTNDPLLVRWGDWFGRAALAPGAALLFAIQWLASRRAKPGDPD